MSLAVEPLPRHPENLDEDSKEALDKIKKDYEKQKENMEARFDFLQNELVKAKLQIEEEKSKAKNIYNKYRSLGNSVKKSLGSESPEKFKTMYEEQQFKTENAEKQTAVLKLRIDILEKKLKELDEENQKKELTIYELGDSETKISKLTEEMEGKLQAELSRTREQSSKMLQSSLDDLESKKQEIEKLRLKLAESKAKVASMMLLLKEEKARSRSQSELSFTSIKNSPRKENPIKKENENKILKEKISKRNF